MELFKDDAKMYFKGASQYVMNYHKDKKSRLISALSYNNIFNNKKKLQNIKKNKF